MKTNYGIKWKIYDILDIIEFKIDDIIEYLKPSYREVLMFTLPENMLHDKWVTVEASMDDVKLVGVTGRYHKTKILSAQLKIKFTPKSEEDN